MIRLVDSESLASNNANSNSNSAHHQSSWRITSIKNGVASSSPFIFHENDDDSLALSVGNSENSMVRGTTTSSISSRDAKKIYKHGSGSYKERLYSVVRSTFLPIGFPNKTPPGYLSYALWSWIQDLSTQLRAILATQRVLEGIGVGREGATALSASLNFIVRDGCGMASNLIFTAASADKFRSNVKKWRLFADIMNDVGITLEVAATLVPASLFLPMICIGNMCKAVCGVAAGACNGSINVHWAKGSDISDINAKFGAQQTVTGSLGLIFAAIFAQSVSTVPSRLLWMHYFSLTLIHIVANVKCMKLIAFDYFNTNRMDIAIEQFFEGLQNMTANKNGYGPGLIDNPVDLSKKEKLFYSISKPRGSGGAPTIGLGVSFESLAQTTPTLADTEGIAKVASDLTEQNYAIGLKSSRKNTVIEIGVVRDASGYEKAKAYFHGHLLRKLLMNQPNTISIGKSQVLEEINEANKVLWPVFEKSAIKAGWNLEKTELSTRGYEIAIQAEY